MKPLAAILRNAVCRISSNASEQEARPDVDDVIAQARHAGSALRALGWRVVEVECDTDLQTALATLKSCKPAVVVNLVESIADNGFAASGIPALLRQYGYACTGSDSSALFISNDKAVARTLLAANGVPVPQGSDIPSLMRGAFEGAGRYIVKSRCEHASVGLDDSSVVTVDSAAALLSVMQTKAAQLGGDCVAERFIDGREFSVALIEAADGSAEVLGVAEMLFSDALPVKILGYDAKWTTGSQADAGTRRSFAFAAEEPALAASLSDAASRCWNVLGLRGYARVDFRAEPVSCFAQKEADNAARPKKSTGKGGLWREEALNDGSDHGFGDDEGDCAAIAENANAGVAGSVLWKLYVIDVNANPCLSPDAGYMAAAAECGKTPEQVFAAIIDAALRHSKHNLQ